MKYLCQALFLSSFILFIGCKSNTKTVIESNGMLLKDITQQEAKKMISENKDLVILDLRTDSEVAKGMINGAVQLDYKKEDFKTKLGTLDKDKPYLIYCASGGRSGKTLKMMETLAFKEGYNLLGGFNDWVK